MKKIPRCRTRLRDILRKADLESARGFLKNFSCSNIRCEECVFNRPNNTLNKHCEMQRMMQDTFDFDDDLDFDLSIRVTGKFSLSDDWYSSKMNIDQQLPALLLVAAHLLSRAELEGESELEQ